ncbi:MAG: riboflavin synthase [Deltaproteobacteria bacterium]|nr:riboflavin synthase [Deltaproteobacteria bacterium]
MFTGIIEAVGTIRESRAGNGLRLTVESGFPLDGVKLGDSIAVSGACLTVVRLSGNVFDADVSPETCRATTLGQARPGKRVNLERALTFSGRLDGHLVTGHVDGTGRLESVKQDGNFLFLDFSAPKELCRYMVAKGSIAIDGVSLTINTVSDSGFSVAIIPHTAKLTTVGSLRAGEAVNLETDIIAKYVEAFTKRAMDRSEGGLSRELLARKGFL